MYKAIYKIQPGCLDEQSQTIFSPFINCYYLHSAIILVNGQAQEEYVDFVFKGHKTHWTGEFALEASDTIVYELNYFHIRPDDIEVLGFLVDSSFGDPNCSKKIISKHYTEGQFCLDSGLYKNAVLNFGTMLEALLNKNLQSKDFVNLIKNYSGKADKTAMTLIRELRNKVHPNRISQTQDITKEEAIKTRNQLEVIINTM